MNEEQLKAFPEAIRDWDEAKTAESPEIFWDQMTNLRSKIGTGLYQPGNDAGSEDWGKFTNKAIELSGDRLIPRPDLEDSEQRNALFRTLGMPEDAKGYEFADIEGAPELATARKEFLSGIALEIGLTKSQLKTLDQKVREVDLNSMNDAQASHDNGLKELKQEWGFAYDERVFAAKKIAATFFPHLDVETNFGAEELKAFQSISKQLGGGSKEFRDQGNQHSDLITPLEAADKIAEIRNNKEHPYNDRLKVGHDAAKKRMRELYLIKNNLPPK